MCAVSIVVKFFNMESSLKTTFPVPVFVETPVPPRSTARIPVSIFDAFIAKIPAPFPKKFADTFSTVMFEGSNELLTVPYIKESASRSVMPYPFPNKFATTFETDMVDGSRAFDKVPVDTFDAFN